MYKSNVGDFPLQVHPCKYWWVRYAVACTFFSEKYQDLQVAALKMRGLPEGFSYRKYIPDEFKELAKNSSDLRYIEQYEISVFDEDKKEYHQLDSDSEEHRFILSLLHDKIRWVECPFENDDQSKCPFYSVEPHYKDMPLEELRQRKGYEL